MNGNKARLAMAVIVFTLSIGTLALASGFLIYEHGARATGLAGTLTARGGDVSAMVYNPAGLSLVKGTNFSVGTTLIFQSGSFAGSNPFPGFGVTHEYEDRVFFPSNLYFSHQLDDELTVGVAVFNPFGLEVDWKNPEQFSGRYIAFKSVLRSFYANPTIAYKMSPELSIAAGLQAVYATVELNRYFGAAVNGRLYDAAIVKLEGDAGIHFGFNGGIRFQPMDKLSIGVAYRSQVEIDIDGDATFTQIPISPTIDPAVAAVLPQNQKVKTSVTFPDILSLGIGYQLTEKLDVAFDAVFTGWSSFEKLVIEFPATPSLTSTTPENWSDEWNFRFGAQYQWNDRLALRAGYLRDITPQPKAAMSPLLPDADRHDFTFGFGYKLSDALTLDLANMLVLFDERNTDGKSSDNFNGEYRLSAYLVGFNLTYNF